MNTLRLLPEVSESGPLANLIGLQSGLDWDLLRVLDPNQVSSRNQFVSSSPPIRLDALENYIRGIMAGSNDEKVKRLPEAERLSPSYSLALFQLANTHTATPTHADSLPTLTT